MLEFENAIPHNIIHNYARRTPSAPESDRDRSGKLRTLFVRGSSIESGDLAYEQVERLLPVRFLVVLARTNFVPENILQNLEVVRR